jgi:hypothetical protein
MSQLTTDKPVPREGTHVIDQPPQPRCYWFSHLFFGNQPLHTTTHAISPTGQIAHVTACDGKEYCLALKDIYPHTKAYTMIPWDLDFSDSFYKTAYSVVGTKVLYPFRPV